MLPLDVLLLELLLDEGAWGYVPPDELLSSWPLLMVPLVTAGGTVVCIAPPDEPLPLPGVMFGVVVTIGAPVLFAPEQPATASITRTTRVMSARYFFKKGLLEVTFVILLMVSSLYSSPAD